MGSQSCPIKCPPALRGPTQCWWRLYCCLPSNMSAVLPAQYMMYSYLVLGRQAVPSWFLLPQAEAAHCPLVLGRQAVPSWFLLPQAEAAHCPLVLGRIAVPSWFLLLKAEAAHCPPACSHAQMLRYLLRLTDQHGLLPNQFQTIQMVLQHLPICRQVRQ